MPEPFLTVELLPALHGDAILVEYGTSRTRRLLIDGGPLGAYPALERRLKAFPEGRQAIELLVITHVDTDHIEGIIRLLALPTRRWPMQLEQVWFNGWRHLEEARDLGGREGEFVSALIHQRAPDAWNTAFDRRAVRCGVVAGDTVTLADGMTLTLLSPDAAALAALLKDWKAALSGRNWSMEPGDLEAAWEKLVESAKFHPGEELTLGPGDLTADLRRILRGVDPSAANGSSIAFIAEYAEKRVVFLGDAHMDVICASLRRLGYSEERPLRADAVKVAHHGSKHNTTPEFLGLVDATHWLFSTNGAQHDHPDPETVEAIIAGSLRPPTLWFNYRSRFTAKWDPGEGDTPARHRARYPANGSEGILITL